MRRRMQNTRFFEFLWVEYILRSIYRIWSMGSTILKNKEIVELCNPDD